MCTPVPRAALPRLATSPRPPSKRGSAALGTGVHIVVAGEREDLLGHWRRTIPVPRGAGINRMWTEPHLACTLHGTVCGSPSLVPQYPRRIGITESLASTMAARIAFATSFEHLTPSPT